MSASEQQSPSLVSSALRGIQWTTAAAVTTALLQVGYTAVMARLLPPAAFGLVALAGVVLRFGGYFAEMGLGHALVQKPELTDKDVRATFTAACLLGLGVAGLTWALAPLATLFWKEDAVVPLVRIMALGFVLTSLGTTATSLLRRRMQFATLAKLEVLTYVLAYGGVGVTLALNGAGVWSLVAASMAQQALLSALTYAATRHSLRPLWERAHYAPLLRYGSRVSVISFLEFLNSNLDTLLIGRLLGPALLGIYNRAFMLLFLPAYFLANSIARVAFPAFSQIQAQLERLRSYYLASTTLVATLVLPLCAGVAVAAPSLVRVLLGPQWDAAVPVLRILCIAIGFNLTTLFAGVVADARANLQQKVWLNLQYLTLLAGLFGLLRGYGLLGIAAAVSVGEAVRAGMYMRITRLDLGLSLPQLLRVYVPGLGAALAVSGGILGVSWGLSAYHLPALPLLLIQMTTGAVLLLAVLLRWPPAEVCPALSKLLTLLRRPAALRAEWLLTTLDRYEQFLLARQFGAAVPAF